ncbi:immunoglobulin superfamily member 11 isoform X4 [Pogona vitticeps]|uniref:immunoglobulin superfamily member 11 isoform X4 n=1 Tax=Pogona vitticeps TaxID=103695 RepID=UPI003BB936FD
MTCKGSSSWGLWVAPLAALLSLRGLVSPLEVFMNARSVEVARGQTAILPCTFTTSASFTNLNVIWMVTPLSNANQPEQVIIYQGGQIFDGAPQFYGRVGFAMTMPTTSASIFINNTQLSDTGTYQCLVNNPPDRGGRNIGVIGLNVLVPPSAPICRIQGSLNIGSDITLNCNSEEGIPRPTYHWEKLDSAPKLPPTATQDQVQGTVVLRNISTVSSGRYQCVASNVIGSSTCSLEVQVIAPHPRSIGLIAGAAAAGAVVLIICILLVAVTLFYWKNKHKEEEEEEIPNEIRWKEKHYGSSCSCMRMRKAKIYIGTSNKGEETKSQDCAFVIQTHASSARSFEQMTPFCHLNIKKK